NHRVMTGTDERRCLMQTTCFTWKGFVLVMAALAMLGTGGLRGAEPPPDHHPPRPLPREIIEAWQQAGAEVGWMRVGEHGYHFFLPEKEGKAGDQPAFRFATWREGLLAKLPAPARAFGLSLDGTQITDAGLKELASLKNLHALDLHRTPVTDAGLKELAGLESLRALDLGWNPVTDAG